MGGDTIVMSSLRAWVVRSVDGLGEVTFFQSSSIWVGDVSQATIFPNLESAQETAQEFIETEEDEDVSFDAVSFYSVVTRGPLARVN